MQRWLCAILVLGLCVVGPSSATSTAGEGGRLHRQSTAFGSGEDISAVDGEGDPAGGTRLKAKATPLSNKGPTKVSAKYAFPSKAFILAFIVIFVIDVVLSRAGKWVPTRGQRSD